MSKKTNKKVIILKYRAILATLLILGTILFTWAEGVLSRGRDNAQQITNVQEVLSPHQELEHANETITPIMPAPSEEFVNETRPQLVPLSQDYIQQLMNFNYLTNRIFLVDPSTILLPTDIDVKSFLQADLSIDTTVSGPQVLIFHTHSAEMFIDSNPDFPMTGIMGVGAYLTHILAEKYNIEVLHHTGRFDVPTRSGSYERMEPVITQILKDNPSIQVVIDLHRDGVHDHMPPFVTYIDGTRTAQIMFFNGLSRQHRNGQVVPLEWLYNPYQQENLNFSLRLQLAANQLYPGIARRVYLRAFRYSLHMAPLSTLVEVGNQHNTQREAFNAMYPLANIIAAVVGL